MNCIKVLKRNWIKVNDSFNEQHSVNENVTPMLRSSLCDNNDVYIVVKGTIDLLAAATNGNEKHRKMLRVKLTLNLGLVYEKNRTLMENAEDLNIVMPMYNLFKCSDNYFMTLGSL